MAQLIGWRCVLRYGTQEERDALIASLPEKELEIAMSTLDVSDERMMAWVRLAVHDCVRSLQRKPFDAPV